MLNNLFLGDNLEILRERIPTSSIDLVYLDPPFFLDREFILNAVDGSIGFKGDWGNGEVPEFVNDLTKELGNKKLARFLAFMHFRIVELHRVLSDSGSLFFHIGPNEAPYIKLLLDITFGMNNHRSTITWQRSHPHNNVKNALGSVSDFIFYYTKSDNFVFNLVYKEHDSKYLANSFNNADSRGRYALAPIIQEKSRKGHVYEFNGITPPFGWRVKIETLAEMHSKDLIHWGSSRPYKKIYLDEAKGTPLQNIWTDIHNITRTDVDKRHYPTQKPVKLLERIVSIASNDGALVLDPFCGSGTTLVAAKNLGRNYIGIDANPEAIEISQQRLDSTIFESSLF